MKKTMRNNYGWWLAAILACAAPAASAMLPRPASHEAVQAQASSCRVLPSAQSAATDSASCKAPAGKEVYIPKDLRGNDFTDPNSKWSYSRCAYTDDIIIFWEKPFGDDLSKAPALEGHDMRVDLPNLLNRIQSFYNYFKNDLQFIKPGSNADRYRMMVMLNYSLEGTAYGGDYDGVIGALWISPNRVQDTKLNCIAHELGHSFQSMIACDKQGESWGGGGIFEMASQWMLFNVNPEWPTDENFHWNAFIDHANLRFLDIENIYHSPYLLEYWSMKHGITVIGDLFRAGKRGEDPASTYMRLYDLSNKDFATEAVDCYSRLLTFDFPGKHEANKKYSGQFINSKPLQTFGANVIHLDTKGKATIKVKFDGNKEDGFAYRLVAVDQEKNATYGDICTKAKGQVKMNIPANATDVYLVITGYPLGEYEPYTFSPYSEEKPDAPHIYNYTIKY